jgi:hypothetical protein
MASSPDNVETAACRCGQVALSVQGPPIVRAACYCTSCQEAGRRLGRLPGASPVLGADGGTDYLLFRKDRVRCTQGGERLEELRLKPGSPTRRLVAACCNTAMFADFTKGHWLSLYRGRIAGPVPPLQMRVMTAEKREDVALPNDAPAYPGHAGALIWRLVRAWAAMGFRMPAVDGVPRQARALQLGESDV